jgi:ribosome-associated protein
MGRSIVINDSTAIDAAELRFTASRSGGPGGQHVNRTNSRVTLHWRVDASLSLSPEQKDRVRLKLAGRIGADGELQISVDTERSLHRNRQIAVDRFAALLAAALRPVTRRIPTRVSAAADRRRLARKRRTGLQKKSRAVPPPD